MKKYFYLLSTLFLAAACSSGPKDGEYELHLFTTNDVHGTYFDSTYVSTRTKNSLMAVNHYVDSVRNAIGADKVILVDAGDCLQGDNASYYYNYVETSKPHLYARLVNYMKYDAVTVGNHDIETGHPVYDRVRKDMGKIPWLAANAIDTQTGKPYFQDYTVIRRQGLKIAILGFTNPNMKNWLTEKLWSGMEFESLLPYVQDYVDKVQAKEHPQVTIVLVHSGTGEGDGSIYESQGLDLFKTLHGVDFLVCSHDHRPFTAQSDSLCLINSGSHCRNIGHGTLNLTVENGQVVSKTLSAGLIPVRKDAIDPDMEAAFHDDYVAVKEFTLRPVGDLTVDLVTRDSYAGQCDYMNLIHRVSLTGAPAQISFAAPLTYNGFIKSGTLLYNDLFTVYPYENELFVVKMSGEEIRNYLEYSYDTWINTVTGKGKDEHILKIQKADDPRTGQQWYSFIARSYNFDSAAGINYTVDVTKPYGERVCITTLANGEEFSAEGQYNVAMTSYRASGGGDLMREGAGIDTDNIDERIMERYPAIRDMLYDYLTSHGGADPAEFGDPDILGTWSFVPEKIAQPLLSKDMALMFKR
ncbi:MAG: bifunctional metallophosphatase/5'-nucleotidase [Bacteroidales bacterium]|nr:bifunctional metallophosphatase/5'-nucleotidase [Bacteroidales bacterium]